MVRVSVGEHDNLYLEPESPDGFQGVLRLVRRVNYHAFMGRLGADDIAVGRQRADDKFPDNHDNGLILARKRWLAPVPCAGMAAWAKLGASDGDFLGTVGREHG